MMKRVIVSLAITALILSSVGLGQSNQPAELRPNMIFILVDDLRWDELGIMGHPFLKTPNIDRIGGEGALFRNAFVTTPLCSPSRAGFLTGQYPRTHGITDNIDRSAASHKLITFPLLLRRSGYGTAFIGKWHMGNDDSPRPGFDRWVSFKGQGSYIDPEINEDGKDVKPRGYITDILNGYAVEFIKRRHDKPFMVYLAHKAIHPEVMQHGDGSVNLDHAERFIPAERHKELFKGKKIPRRPSAMQPPTGKPALQRQIGDLPSLGANTATRDEAVLGRLRSMMAVEEGVGEIFRALKATGQLDNTVIVFTSDNGYFNGEHGLSVERRLAYEESIRMPLLVRYPKAIKAGTVLDEFALNIDVAPTLLELAGVSVPKEIEGRSLVSLLRGGKPEWRNSFVIEYYSDRVFPRIRQMGYKALRNERWKYIHYFELEGMDELYDLKSDPFEMKNLINEPAAAETLNKMKRELEALVANGAASTNGLKRMYVLDCGRLLAKDQSRWTPGVNAGKPRELSNNCYLFQHERGTLLWETGVPDSVVEQKDGVTSPNGAVVWFRDKTLASQLESIGVNPNNITYVAVSHTHGDHIGNANAFAKSKLLIQKLEHELAMKATTKPFSDDQNVEMLSGDRDVFGDGSVTIISTPGHTPGHQSLLVKLPKTGALILTGDLVHFQYMWDNKIVPPFNFNKQQSLDSIERVIKLLAEHKAQIWIGHDKDITARIDRVPKFYE